MLRNLNCFIAIEQFFLSKINETIVKNSSKDRVVPVANENDQSSMSHIPRKELFKMKTDKNLHRSSRRRLSATKQSPAMTNQHCTT